MTDFLYRLVDRTLSLAPVAAPLVGGMFAPSPDRHPTGGTVFEESNIERASISTARSTGAGGVGDVLESPMRAGLADETAPPGTDRFSPAARKPGGEFEGPFPETTSVPSLTESMAQPYMHEVHRIDKDRAAQPQSLVRAVTPDAAPFGRDRPSLDRRVPSGVVENQRATSLIQYTDPTAERRELPKDIQTEKTHLGDVTDRPRGLKALTPARRVDLDSSDAVRAVVPTRDLKHHPLGLEPDGPLLTAEYPTVAFEQPGYEVFPQSTKSNIALSGSLDDQFNSADAAVAVAVKPRRSDKSLDSRHAQRPEERIGSLSPSSSLAGHNSRVLNVARGVVQARQPIVVTPRLMRDSPRNNAHATDQPSVTPAAGQTSSRRENNSASAPTIRVTIGRIEVRAVHTPAPAPNPKRAQRTAPRMTLDAYLRKRNGGSR